MANEGPKFMRERWAACAERDCERFGKYYLVEVPYRSAPCKGCGQANMRQSTWSSWKAAKQERRAVVQLTLHHRT